MTKFEQASSQIDTRRAVSAPDAALILPPERRAVLAAETAEVGDRHEAAKDAVTEKTTKEVKVLRTEVESARKEKFQMGAVVALDRNDDDGSRRDRKADSAVRYVVVGMPTGNGTMLTIRVEGRRDNKDDIKVSVDELLLLEAAAPMGAGAIKAAAALLDKAPKGANEKETAVLKTAIANGPQSAEFQKALSVNLSENPQALQGLAVLLKFLNEIMVKFGLTDFKPLTDYIEKTDKKLAAFEWGEEKPTDPKKLQEQKNALDKNEGLLTGWKESLKAVTDLKGLESQAKALAAHRARYAYKANQEKFQDAFDERKKQLEVTAPDKPKDAALAPKAFENMNHQEKVTAALAAFGKLGEGESLTTAGAAEKGPKFFEFNKDAEPVTKGDRAFQTFSFLGVACQFDYNSDETEKRLRQVVRAQRADGVQGVNFNGGFVPFESQDGRNMKEYLLKVLNGQAFDINWAAADTVPADVKPGTSAPETPAARENRLYGAFTESFKDLSADLAQSIDAAKFEGPQLNSHQRIDEVDGVTSENGMIVYKKRTYFSNEFAETTAQLARMQEILDGNSPKKQVLDTAVMKFSADVQAAIRDPKNPIDEAGIAAFAAASIGYVKEQLMTLAADAKDGVMTFRDAKGIAPLPYAEFVAQNTVKK